ncbi:hypothetical protein [Nesterenkonia sp. Act20]|uniref:hypothetical protein n=1 Tax=Nesterenkonia sp. Act20 TaxID=1483432 RepID=UPI001C46B43A|nr:hypothetical protein [Nesterenkonia sp. Act20]
MTPRTAAPLPQGLYRAGPQFSAAELQVLVHEGALRPLVADVYASARLPDSPGLRALGCHELLAPGLRAGSVLCGETAAWVHLGGTRRPEKVSVITDGVFRRTTAAVTGWQVHQMPLEPGHVVHLQGIPVTSPVRTAADVFLGIGTSASRSALDQPAPQAYATDQQDARASTRRWELIRRLADADPEAVSVQGLTAQIRHQLRGRTELQRRQEQISALLKARVFGVRQ